MSYLEFREDVFASGRHRTRVWRVHSAQHGGELGTIKWFGRWRQYTFNPEPGTTFNPDCLREIASYCFTRTQLHRTGNR